MSNPNASPRTSYWLCPLYSFNCDCESMDLAKGIQIKPALDKLRKYIGEQTYHLYGRWEDPSKFDWAAFLPHPTRATEGTIVERMKIGFKEWDEAGDSLFNLIIALKLCHEGRIIAGPLISASIHDSEWSIGGGTIWTRVSEKDFAHEKPEYILHRSDIPKINELFKKLCEEERPYSIDTALRRFNAAYHGWFEDRLIDQMIAFESLYIADDKELGYKLALRTAFLLGKKRAKIFSDMRKAYDLRGQIVHGNKQVDRSKLEETIPKTEEYLRQSIRRFLSLSKRYSIAEIRKQLDENVLKNGKLLAIRE